MLNRTLFSRIATATLLTALATASLANAREIDRSFTVNEGETLTVKTDAGSIEILTHNSDSIDVRAEIEGSQEDDFDVSFDVNGDGLTIRGQRENGHGWSWNSLKVKYQITVPKRFNLDLDTSGGSIEIEDLIGEIKARTSGGSISVGDVEGDISLHTSGGSIRTQDIMGEIDAHTSGGSINVTFAKQPQQDASLTTSGGSITARLPSDVAIDIDASTSGGRVKSEFDVSGKVKKQRIRGKINGGGPELELHTSGGSVRVEKI
ncbi:DUF4097 family beta strand repeat-containing protein [Alteromonas sp. H39]|uniref:DUF4097 family beta strand repeat-containing protein n=1 Tax=Alteromonas sp. H39 TaxID=3389876 RepID=UPI0039E0B0E1